MDLHRKRAAALTVPLGVRRSLPPQIKQLDAEIGPLVYELYELTEEEIGVVEERNH